MRTTRAVAATLVLALLLLPTAPAAPQDPTATAVTTAGDYVLDGALVALRHHGSMGSGTDEPLGLHLQAASVVVREENSAALQAGGANLLEAQDQRSTRTVHNATVSEAATHPGRDLTVIALDARVQATGRGATLTPSERTTVDARDEVEFSDQATQVPVGHTVQVEGMPALTITGHFLVLASEMDLAVRGDDGERVHSARTTGDLGTATYPGDVEAPSNRNVTELVLEVRDGTLHLGPGTGHPWFHVTAPRITLSSARLDGVTGTLPSSLRSSTTDGGTVTLRGDLSLDLDAAGAALAWDLSGRIDDARLDGVPLAVVAPLPGGPAARAWLPWTTALLLAGLAAVGGLPAHRRNARRRLHDAELLLASGHFQAAAEVARPRPLTGVRGPTAALRVQALLHAGAVHEARRLARAAARRSDPTLSRLVLATVDDWEEEP